MYRLELLGDQGTSASYVLVTGSTMSVGRQGGNDIVLADSSVSRSHCLFYVESDSVVIEDLDSTNGVRVRGKRVHGSGDIAVNDEVMIGDVRFVLRLADRQADPNETSVVRAPEDHDS